MFLWFHSTNSKSQISVLFLASGDKINIFSELCYKVDNYDLFIDTEKANFHDTLGGVTFFLSSVGLNSHLLQIRETLCMTGFNLLSVSVSDM